MKAPGWTRIDPRPWTKTSAHWVHESGWQAVHCGHPTALTPWQLFNPVGTSIGTGARVGNPYNFGTCWLLLADVFAFVASSRATKYEAV